MEKDGTGRNGNGFHSPLRGTGGNGRDVTRGTGSPGTGSPGEPVPAERVAGTAPDSAGELLRDLAGNGPARNWSPPWNGVVVNLVQASSSTGSLEFPSISARVGGAATHFSPRLTPQRFAAKNKAYSRD